MVLRNVEAKVVGLNNIVVWANPAFRYYQTNLSKGSLSDMGRMLALTPEQKKSSRVKVGIRDGHHRAATWLGKPRTQREFAFFWRDINLKGVGQVSGDSNGSLFGRISKNKTEGVMWQVAVKKDYDSGQYYDSETEVRGLLDYTDAYHDALWAEQLYALGVRTHRTLGIIMLKELVTTEGIESVELLQQRQLLPAGFMPVVQVRAFGTELRVSDLTVKPRFQEATLNDVYQLIGEELGITVSGENYLDWFAATLAKNMGRLHQAGLVHGSISAHNITLDCRLVDHDTMYRPRQHASSTQYAESSGDSIGRTAEEVLRSLCFLLGNGPRFEEVVLFYKEAYHRFMPRPARASVASEEEQTVA